MIVAIRLFMVYGDLSQEDVMARVRGWLRWIVFMVGYAFFVVPMTARAQSAEEASGVFVRTPETIRWSEQLRDIVLSHPREEVSETLNTMILEGVVVLAFDADIALGGDGDATVLLLPVDGAGVQIVLNLQPSLFDEQKAASDQYRTVFHECVHIGQLFTGSPTEYFYARDGATPCSEDEAMTIFRNEVEAYCQECQLAMDMGWPTDDALCAAYRVGGSTALANVLATNLVQRLCFAPYLATMVSYAVSLSTVSLSLRPSR